MKVEMQTESDEKLMALYQNGNLDAFSELYYRYNTRVYGFLRAKTSCTEDANDITQAVFLKFHQSRSQYSEKYPLASWIFTISRSVLIDHYRKKKDIPLSLEKEMNLVSPDAEDKENESELMAKANDAIRSLKTDERQLVNFRFKEGLSYEQISKKLGIGTETLRKRMSRTMGLLKKVQK